MTRITHISDTAFLVAKYRAEESQRTNPLFVDPFAARLAGARAAELGKTHLTRPMIRWIVVVRTVVIDDLINTAIANGVATIVNLGAGLDARPYRMDLPKDLTWIEVDYEDVLQYKADVLRDEKPKCNLVHMPTNLTDDVERENLFSQLRARSGKLLVLTEGVIPYLTEEQVDRLSADLKSLPNLYGWVLEWLSPRVDPHRRQTRVGANVAFNFRPPDQMQFFKSRGWRVRDIRFLGVVGRKLRRPAPYPWKAKIIAFFFRKVDRFMGFVVLEAR